VGRWGGKKDSVFFCSKGVYQQLRPEKTEDVQSEHSLLSSFLQMCMCRCMRRCTFMDMYVYVYVYVYLYW